MIISKMFVLLRPSWCLFSILIAEITVVLCYGDVMLIENICIHLGTGIDHHLLLNEFQNNEIVQNVINDPLMYVFRQ